MITGILCSQRAQLFFKETRTAPHSSKEVGWMEVLYCIPFHLSSSLSFLLSRTANFEELFKVFYSIIHCYFF